MTDTTHGCGPCHFSACLTEDQAKEVRRTCKEKTGYSCGMSTFSKTKQSVPWLRELKVLTVEELLGPDS